MNNDPLEGKPWALHNCDCVELLRSLPDNCIHALATDPPAGIGFMSLDFDSDKGGRDNWIGWLQSIMAESLRVCKPGSHGVVWTLPRRSHWTMLALEKAGWEIRDCIAVINSQGFPKGIDLSKAIDKSLGAERKVIGKRIKAGMGSANTLAQDVWTQANRGPVELDVTEPATPEAAAWAGWNSTMRPGNETWVLIRKPLSEVNLATNVLRWGVGGINIGACRVGSEARYNPPRKGKAKTCYGFIDNPDGAGNHCVGRWPSNVVISDGIDEPWSKYFYCPKVSPSERGSNGHPTLKPLELMRWLCRLVTPPSGIVLDPFAGSASTGVAALSEGFRFLGAEIGDTYFNVGLSRLQQTLPIEVAPV